MGCFTVTVTGRHEPITDDGDMLGRVLAIHSYMGVTNELLSNLFKGWTLMSNVVGE